MFTLCIPELPRPSPSVHQIRKTNSDDPLHAEGQDGRQLVKVAVRLEHARVTLLLSKSGLLEGVHDQSGAEVSGEQLVKRPVKVVLLFSHKLRSRESFFLFSPDKGRGKGRLWGGYRGGITDLLLGLVVRKDAPPRRHVEVLCDDFGADHVDRCGCVLVLFDDLEVAVCAGREEDWV